MTPDPTARALAEADAGDTLTAGAPVRAYIVARLITPRPDCQLWANACDRGYGRIYLDGRAQRVHRVMWELDHGPIPDGLTIDHLCRVRNCVNTAHMELVTAAENLRRAEPFRAERTATHCKQDHEYTPENTAIWRDGFRRCRTCEAARSRERRAAPPS